METENKIYLVKIVMFEDVESLRDGYSHVEVRIEKSEEEARKAMKDEMDGIIKNNGIDMEEGITEYTEGDNHIYLETDDGLVVQINFVQTEFGKTREVFDTECW